MGVSSDVKTIKDRVAALLEDKAALRDSDKLLWLEYLREYHWAQVFLGDAAWNQLKSIIMDPETPSPESIRRVRQKLQEEGLYLGKNRNEMLDEAEAVRSWAKKPVQDQSSLASVVDKVVDNIKKERDQQDLF